ncbi:MAG: NifB/NifX family molybdenum-iron cluster-binding protein [Deltaproteobacteria bacterium]|nr:NifB/NifX family molybdenum-iron cluster-binding protein [Deltaproteobacteria bacterium]
MKIAIPAKGQDITSPFEQRFGRTRWFIVVDADSRDWKAYSNDTNMQAVQGAGIQTAQRLADLAVDTVISANVGPKAFRTLKAAGIRIFMGTADTVEQALTLFQEGRFPEASDANVESHWV